MRSAIRSGWAFRIQTTVALYCCRSSAIWSGVMRSPPSANRPGRTGDAPCPPLLAIIRAAASGHGLHRLLEDVEAGAHVRRRVVGVGLVLDADVALEVDVLEGLEHGGHVEGALAVDHVGLALVVVVLEVDA